MMKLPKLLLPISFALFAVILSSCSSSVAGTDLEGMIQPGDQVGEGDYAVYLYRGEGSNVQWKGEHLTRPYTQVGTMWMMLNELEPDFMSDYKIVIDGEEIRDPLNPLTRSGT